MALAPVNRPDTVTPELVEAANVAVTERAAFMETTHDPLPLHAPPHPLKLEPEAAEALSVTEVPDA